MDAKLERIKMGKKRIGVFNFKLKVSTYQKITTYINNSNSNGRLYWGKCYK